MLDEEVARLQLWRLGARLTALTQEPADYNGNQGGGAVQAGALQVLTGERRAALEGF